jgi:predicted O-linked N-acetylglucosamine transferase (SPINDLY family)
LPYSPYQAAAGRALPRVCALRRNTAAVDGNAFPISQDSRFMNDVSEVVLSSATDFVSHILPARRGTLSLNDLFNCAARLEAEGQRELAAVLYETWLAHSNTPLNHFAYFNLGTTLFSLDDMEGAKRAYCQAIALSPSFVQPHFNLGLVHERMKQPEDALTEWSWVADNTSAEQPEDRPLKLLALNNMGRLYEVGKQYAQALTSLTRSLELEPNQPDAIHHWVFLRGKQCVWPVHAPVGNVPPELVRQSTSALAMISLSDDPEAQLAAAQNFVRNKIRTDVPLLTDSRGYGHKKIRIAYLSSDFCLHPVSMLTAELFELHDRKRFEVYGFCWSPEDGSGIRQRIIKSMDHFERIHELTDEAAAKLIRSYDIDILVDLHGQTFGARPNLLAYRPAPIQITYLGLPATTGLPFIDYVIADRFLIPKKSAQFYTEKPLYMPDVYQVSDRQRLTGPTPTRESCGLPQDAFVFCSFNNNFKFTPDVFAVWMNILRRVPNSVLWLLADNEWAEANLRNAAAQSGIDGSRLIFASRVAPENYLARYRIADLFLDTFPFNAGTTANDALWMSLPVLTYSGHTFASRMAGALLTAAGIEELITYNLTDYEEKAVALANDPQARARLKAQLDEVKESGVLFDTPRFTRNLEKHFKRLVGALD